MSNIPKMGHLPTPAKDRTFSWRYKDIYIYIYIYSRIYIYITGCNEIEPMIIIWSSGIEWEKHMRG